MLSNSSTKVSPGLFTTGSNLGHYRSDDGGGGGNISENHDESDETTHLNPSSLELTLPPVVTGRHSPAQPLVTLVHHPASSSSRPSSQNDSNNNQNQHSFALNLISKWFPHENGADKAKLIKKPQNIAELVWKNLCYDVNKKQWTNVLKSKSVFSQKRLLNSISGSFRSGELIAIMGPSGAGKTTLIECISGRRRIGVSGEIFVKGGDKRTRLSYNAQDDSLMPCLTVYETLMFASKLRNFQRNNRLKVKLMDDNENVYNATTVPTSELEIR